MAKLTPQDILKLARLAKLQLTEEELAQFANELTAITEYIEQLSSVDTNGLKPTSQVTGLTSVMRKDEVINYGPTPDDLLKNAPATENHHIKVKRVLG